MILGTQNKKQMGILAVVGVGAIGAGIYMYTQLFPSDTPPPAAPVVITSPSPAAARTSATVARKLATPPTGAPGTPRSAVAVAEAQLDPTLHMEAMLVTESLVYTGRGRNIFSAAPEPIAIPKVVARVRPPDPIAPVRPPMPTGPPPPPPIDLKLFGVETTATGERKGFLLHGEDVFFVSSGDIVQRRYRVVSITARSLVIEDVANSNQQTLPLLAN